MKKTNSLASEHYLFFVCAVSGYENISVYWDFRTGYCNIKGLEGCKNELPANEKVMANFFLAIWSGKNVDFDLIRDISILSPDDVGIIIDWCKHPYFFSFSE